MHERLTPGPPQEMPQVDRLPGTAVIQDETPAHLADPRALQILQTEHWSLLSQRSLAWNETFSRAGMYLATLSAATVALALVASVMREGFTVFALIILPVVFFIGLATIVRLAQSNDEDARTVQGMNRIRHAYLEIAPELEPYFVMSRFDDLAGIMVSLGAPPDDAPNLGPATRRGALGGILHGFVTTIGMIMVINSVVAAVFVGLVVAGLDGGIAAAIVAGVVVFLILLAIQAIWGIRHFMAVSKRTTVRFPSSGG